MYCLVHVLDNSGLRGTWWREAEARDTAFQIDRYAQLLQKIHPEDSVDLAATRFGDGAQVNRRQLNAQQDVIAQGEFADRNCACIESSCFIPRLYAARSARPPGK